MEQRRELRRPCGQRGTTLTLHLAEDAWQGDAQYSVTVDGKALGTGGTVTASNAQGKSQTVQPAGHPGGRNPRRGRLLPERRLWRNPRGRPQPLRQGVDVNGTAVPGAAASLMTAGTSHFQIVVPAA